MVGSVRVPDHHPVAHSTVRSPRRFAMAEGGTVLLDAQLRNALMNMAPCEIKQSAPMVTSSQMKTWDCTRVRGPMTTSF